MSMDVGMLRCGLGLYPSWPMRNAFVKEVAACAEFGLQDVLLPVPSAVDDSERREYGRSIGALVGHGITPSFHLPSKGALNPAGFRRLLCTEQCEQLLSMLQLIQDVASEHGLTEVLIVAHGAHGRESREQLREDTGKYLEFVSNALSTFQGGHRVLLENLPTIPGVVRIGDHHEDFAALQDQLDRPTHGVCWDVGHAGSPDPLQALCREVVPRIAQVHVHGTDDSGRDHAPVSEADQTLIGAALRNALLTGFAGAVVLEILPNRVGATEDPLTVLRREIVALGKLLGTVSSSALGRDGTANERG